MIEKIITVPGQQVLLLSTLLGSSIEPGDKVSIKKVNGIVGVHICDSESPPLWSADFSWRSAYIENLESIQNQAYIYATESVDITVEVS